MPSTLSVCLIAYNEEDQLGRTLDAVRELATEIVVVDSGSDDRSVDIARAAGARVVTQPFLGYAAQKNFAMAQATGDWILSIDCDEVVQPELADGIRAVLARPPDEAGAPVAYALNRRIVYLGRRLKRAWFPDWKLRLVRRDAGAVWQGVGDSGMHESLRVDGPRGRLPGVCLHYPYDNFADHMTRSVNFARRAALDYHSRGRRVGRGRMLATPPLAFVKEYFLRGAFVDGMPGLVAAWSKANYIYMKYSFLWELGNAPAAPMASSASNPRKRATNTPPPPA